jgi:hypothetical protein
MNSSMPNLRRTYKTSGLPELVPSIRSHIFKTSVFAAFYIALLVGGHITGLFHKLIPDYIHAQWYLLFWVVLMCCSTIRFWNEQFFIVSMQFRFLLRTSLITLSITATGMFRFGLGFESIGLALFSLIVGELVSVGRYYKKQSALLNPK